MMLTMFFPCFLGKLHFGDLQCPISCRLESISATSIGDGIVELLRFENDCVAGRNWLSNNIGGTDIRQIL
jgi:hypothetical protein